MGDVDILDLLAGGLLGAIVSLLIEYFFDRRSKRNMRAEIERLHSKVIALRTVMYSDYGQPSGEPVDNRQLVDLVKDAAIGMQDSAGSVSYVDLELKMISLGFSRKEIFEAFEDALDSGVLIMEGRERLIVAKR